MRQPFDEKLPLRGSSTLVRAHKVLETVTRILIFLSITIIVQFQDSNIREIRLGKGGRNIQRIMKPFMNGLIKEWVYRE
jgi:hypothetical protein